MHIEFQCDQKTKVWKLMSIISMTYYKQTIIPVCQNVTGPTYTTCGSSSWFSQPLIWKSMSMYQCKILDLKKLEIQQCLNLLSKI